MQIVSIYRAKRQNNVKYSILFYKSALFAFVLLAQPTAAEVRYGVDRSTPTPKAQKNEIVKDLGGQAFIDRPAYVSGVFTSPTFELIATSTPTTPSAGRCRIWFNSSDNSLRVIYDDGTSDTLGTK